jgi:hypothetical protein
MNLAQKLIAARLGKILAGGLGTILATIGGITSIKAVQPVVEKASDYGAKAVMYYCELPLVDRQRFHAEVFERLQNAGFAGSVVVSCPADSQ